jgi:hypothetical protein
MLTDGRRTTDDGWKVMAIAHMAWRPGELKNKGQNSTQQTKDRATRTPLKTRVNSGVPEG